MKVQSLLVTSLLFLSTQTSLAQYLNVSTYVEKTHISPKYGTNITYEFQSLIEVGAFYQRSPKKPKAESGRPISKETEFCGVLLAFPIFITDKGAIKLAARTGITNREHFLITPSLLAEYAILPKLIIGTGIGTRAFRATFQASVKFSL